MAYLIFENELHSENQIPNCQKCQSFVSGPNIDNNNKKFSSQLQIIFMKDFFSFSYGSSF